MSKEIKRLKPIKGLPAHKIIYAYTDPFIGNAKAMELTVLNDNNRYDIIFIASSEQFDDTLIATEKLIDLIGFTE